MYKPGLVSFEYYNVYKNIISSILRRAKRNYCKYKFNSAIDNPRKTRRLLNDLINNSRSKNFVK